MGSARVDLAQLGRTTAVVLIPLLISACGIGWQDQQISTVEVRDDRTLVVGYHCDHDATIEADETAEEVRLTFRVYGGSRGECADFGEVELDAPLGGRTIIDTLNDAEIVPCRTSQADEPCS